MPGTGFVRELPKFFQHIFARIATALEPMVDGISHPEKSGRELYQLVTNAELNGQTALYFDGDKAISSSADSYNRDFQHDLWETSVGLCGLHPHETILSVENKVLQTVRN